MPALVDPVAAIEAASLADLGYKSPQISQIVGLAPSTIDDIIAKHGRWGEVTETSVFVRLRAEQNKVLESAFRAGAARLFARAFDEDKLSKASTYQLVTSAAIAVDKARLLGGESTENLAVSVAVSVNLDELGSRLSRRLIDK